jgi:hypothetical protein
VASRTRKRAKSAELAAWLESARLERIGPAEFRAIGKALAPVSESHLRKLIRECGLPLDPVVEGVRQQSIESLERTLVALAQEYEAAAAAGDRTRMRECRQAVLTGREHARWAMRRAGDEQVRERKKEMAEWMLVWLENPGVFATWVRLRRRAWSMETPPQTERET